MRVVKASRSGEAVEVTPQEYDRLKIVLARLEAQKQEEQKKKELKEQSKGASFR